MLRWYLYYMLNKRKIGEMIYRKIIVLFLKLFMIWKYLENLCVIKCGFGRF